MKYIEVINSIEDGLNSDARGRSAKGKTQNILNGIISLKREYGVSISTKYLKGLVTGTKERKSEKVRNFVRKCGFNANNQIKRDVDIVKENKPYIKRAEIVTYGVNKWGEVGVFNITFTDVMKEHTQHRAKTLKFIEID